MFGTNACKVAQLVESKSCFAVYLALQGSQVRRPDDSILGLFKPKSAASKKAPKNRVGAILSSAT